MIRYMLSKAFAKVAYLSDNGKDLRDVSLNHYRDEVLKGVKIILGKFSNKWQMDVENTGTGTAEFKISNAAYPQAEPTTFRISTEWSDLLLASGRQAAFKIESGGLSEILYYGDSWDPDNDYQILGRLRNQPDIEKIVHHITNRSYEPIMRASVARSKANDETISLS